MSAWLAEVGLGEDGMEGLAAAARALIDAAEVLVGGKRHLALVPTPKAVRLPWKQPLSCWRAAIPSIRAWRRCSRVT